MARGVLNETGQMLGPFLIMALLISVGVIIRMLDHDSVRSVSILVLDVAYPAIALSSVGGMSGRIPVAAWYLFIAGITISGVLTILAYLRQALWSQ